MESKSTTSKTTDTSVMSSSIGLSSNLTPTTSTLKDNPSATGLSKCNKTDIPQGYPFLTDECRQRFRDSTPNIIFCGLPKGGKTSIYNVVFCQKSPHEMIYCLPTQTPEVIQVANTRLIKFSVLDVPGNLLIDWQYDEMIFPFIHSLVFVVDAQNDPYSAEIAHCISIFKRASTYNPKIHFEVFIHKIDGDVFWIDEVRAECQREINDKLMSHLHEAGVPTENVIFYSTSIYDHSVFEACSRVVQRLIPQATALEHLLDILLANCRMEKVFLIDVLSKTFIATDTSPYDPLSYELCTDMIEVIIDISCIYGQSLSGQNNIFCFGEEDSSHDSLENGESPSSTTRATLPATSSVIQLNRECTLYVREVDRRVALACVIRANHFDKKQLIDHNIVVFSNAMKELFKTYDPSLCSAGSVSTKR